MKTVEYVSIGGYVFSLEEDACARAKEYLDQLSAFYDQKDSGTEIMEGIEERMAELLLEKCGQGGVVTLSMVSEVISVLGRPETIEEESNDSADFEPIGARRSPKSDSGGGKARRKLYRDPANGKIAGVCSGLAAYFNLDPVIFRIAFVAMTFLGLMNFRFFWPMDPWIQVSMPTIYLVLWICMPAVKSVRQRDELRGFRGTVDDISERVRNASGMKPDIKDTETWKNVRRILSVMFGVFLLLAGVAGIAFLCSFWWGGTLLGNSFFYNKIIENIAVETPELLSFISAPLVVIAAIMVIAIPLLIMLYCGVMLIFGLKSPRWHPGLIMFVVWLIILVALAVSSLMTFTVID